VEQDVLVSPASPISIEDPIMEDLSSGVFPASPILAGLPSLNLDELGPYENKPTRSSNGPLLDFPVVILEVPDCSPATPVKQ